LDPIGPVVAENGCGKGEGAGAAAAAVQHEYISEISRFAQNSLKTSIIYAHFMKTR